MKVNRLERIGRLNRKVNKGNKKTGRQTNENVFIQCPCWEIRQLYSSYWNLQVNAFRQLQTCSQSKQTTTGKIWYSTCVQCFNATALRWFTRVHWTSDNLLCSYTHQQKKVCLVECHVRGVISCSLSFDVVQTFGAEKSTTDQESRSSAVSALSLKNDMFVSLHDLVSVFAMQSRCAHSIHFHFNCKGSQLHVDALTRCATFQLQIGACKFPLKNSNALHCVDPFYVIFRDQYINFIFILTAVSFTHN